MDASTQPEAPQTADASAPPLTFRGASWAWRHRILIPIAWAMFVLVLLFCAGFWRQGEPPLPIAVTALSAVGILLAGWAVARHQASRRWRVGVVEGGLLVTTDGRELALPFSALRGFSVDSKQVAFGEAPERVHRRVHLHTADGTQVISARLEGPGELAAMHRLVELLVEGSLAHARGLLARGGSVDGAGWRADANGLESTGNGKTLRVPWAEISHHEDLGAAHLYWAKDGVRPWLSVPGGSMNALLLAAMFQRPEVAPEAAGPHGRMLWEIRADRGMTHVGVVLLIAGLVGAAWLAWDGMDPLGGVMVAGLGAMGMLLGWSAERRVAFHERGMISRRGRQSQEVSYASAAAFSYRRHVQSEAGFHIGIKGVLSLIPSGGGTPLSAGTDADRLDADEPIVVLRQYLARLWQPRLIAQLETTGSVDWAPGVRLGQEGVRLARGKQGERLVPWTRLRARWADRFEHVLALLECEPGRWTREDPVLVTLDAAAPGFHAAKLLFDSLWEAAMDEAEDERAERDADLATAGAPEERPPTALTPPVITPQVAVEADAGPDEVRSPG